MKVVEAGGTHLSNAEVTELLLARGAGPAPEPPTGGGELPPPPARPQPTKVERNAYDFLAAAAGGPQARPGPARSRVYVTVHSGEAFLAPRPHPIPTAPLGLTTRRQTRAGAAQVLEALQPFALTLEERLQIVNVRPANVVEVRPRAGEERCDELGAGPILVV